MANIIKIKCDFFLQSFSKKRNFFVIFLVNLVNIVLKINKKSIFLRTFIPTIFRDNKQTKNDVMAKHKQLEKSIQMKFAWKNFALEFKVVKF